MPQGGKISDVQKVLQSRLLSKQLHKQQQQQKQEITKVGSEKLARKHQTGKAKQINKPTSSTVPFPTSVAVSTQVNRAFLQKHAFT